MTPIDPQDAGAVAQMTGTTTGLFDSSPSGLLFAAAVVFTGLWVAHRIGVVASFQARLSLASRVFLVALTTTVAKVQAIRLRREIDAWMRTNPADRGVLIIPGETVPTSSTTSTFGSPA